MSLRRAIAKQTRRVTTLIVIALALTLIAPMAEVILASPASAAPSDDEGGTPALREQLDAASRGYLDAKTKLATSEKRQRQVTAELTRISSELATHDAAVGELAGAAYRRGRIGTVSALLDSDSPDALLSRVAALDALAADQNHKVGTLLRTRAEADRAKARVANEIAIQRKQVAAMAARKKQAEKALAAAGRGGGSTTAPGGGTGSGSTGGSASSTPAPRNPDGSWPSESCGVDDPTTSGCITPRTSHALRQAKAAGFTRYVSCFRSGGSGEHPKGRACDFAAQKNGFGGVATGGDRTYGNNLASYFVHNADRLGVLYVIWFQRIWLPSSGWRAYDGGNGDPSSDHTNHVHLSMT